MLPIWSFTMWCIYILSGLYPNDLVCVLPIYCSFFLPYRTSHSLLAFVLSIWNGEFPPAFLFPSVRSHLIWCLSSHLAFVLNRWNGNLTSGFCHSYLDICIRLNCSICLGTHTLIWKTSPQNTIVSIYVTRLISNGNNAHLLLEGNVNCIKRCIYLI